MGACSSSTGGAYARGAVRARSLPSSQVTLDGTLTFHGADHKMSLPAKVEVKDGKVTAQTSFTIPYVEWGLHDPSIMILRVAKVVEVHVVAHGTLEASGAAAAGVR